jgi:hypothetical protein
MLHRICGGMVSALRWGMVASSFVRRSAMLVGNLPVVLPRALDRLVGSVLELMIHTIEGLRDRLAGPQARHTLASASDGDSPDMQA